MFCFFSCFFCFYTSSSLRGVDVSDPLRVEEECLTFVESGALSFPLLSLGILVEGGGEEAEVDVVALCSDGDSAGEGLTNIESVR